MRALLLLLILWCAQGYAGKQKYCESYCNGLRCTECARQRKPLPFTAEKCAKCMSEAPTSKCGGTHCKCPPNPGCGPEKSCNCSASCISAYCNSCPTQTRYTKSQCDEAYQQADTPECKNKPCPCPYIPCPPAKCNCFTLCTCSYCSSCPTQTTYTDAQCESACKAAQAPGCENIKCKCVAQYCPPPKNCNCSAICTSGYCKSCPTQIFYTASQCEEANQVVQAQAPGCKNVACSCPAQPACPPESCCPAKCYGAFCESCPAQTLFPPQTCAQYARAYKSPDCAQAKCICPRIELYCPNPKNCNCSAVCISSYCKNCTTQTIYSNSTCQAAYKQSNTPDCQAAKCNCPAQPACPPENCCPGKCFGPFCESCPTQTLFTPQTCAEYIREYKSPACKNVKCFCPGIELYCPKPQNCNCSAACICSYCTDCKTQNIYSNSTCTSACAQSNNADCKAAKCHCSRQPACPPENCTCPAKCYGPYCASCPTQTVFPPQTCALYAAQYKSPACKNITCFCPQIELYCPNPKNCNCSAACISSYCKDCKTQTLYPSSTCNEAYEESNTPDCEAAKCHCPFQPACPPEKCCPGKCYGAFCESCPTQTLFRPETCAQYARAYKSPDCAEAKCICPRIELYCPNPKNCNCSAVCISNYCKNCTTQTIYSNSTCNKAYEESNTPDCKAAKCSCPAQPACPPVNCCPAKCYGAFCESCPTQTLFPPQTCAQYAQAYKSPACAKAKCICPGIELYCPNPKNCNCSAVCISSYCKDCKTQTCYSNSTCQAAYEQSNTPDCKAANCSCPAQPACPPEKCCPGKCYGAFCESCPTQTLFPPETCAQYARAYKSPDCAEAKCICPRIELYCPNPKNCNCSAVCITNYCKTCTTQTIYSNSTCQAAYEQSNTPDCQAAKCSCPAQPACPSKCNCTAYCNAPYCESCPSQILYPPETCASFIKQAKLPECKHPGCFCSLAIPYCPKPEKCGCEQVRINSYCKKCSNQRKYSKSQCSCAENVAESADCKAAKCDCNNLPPCNYY